MTVRSYFHSFPRRRRGETREQQLEKGGKIAESLLANGILLTPENYEVSLRRADGSVYDSLSAVQRRACFTELEHTALPEHAHTFGPFSLVFDILNLRKLGAAPVFYVPLQESGDHLGGLATEVLGGLTDAMRLVAQLLGVKNHLAQNDLLGLNYSGKQVDFPPESIPGIRLLVDTLAQAAACDLDETRGKLGALSSWIYPTENPDYTGPLHYYHQREWRLVDGPTTFHGQPLFHPPSEAQLETLLDIDPDFFGKELDFFEPKKGIGAKVRDTMGRRSKFLKSVGAMDAVGMARALVLPDDLVDTQALKDAYASRGIVVVTQAEFSDAVA